MEVTIYLFIFNCFCGSKKFFFLPDCSDPGVEKALNATAALFGNKDKLVTLPSKNRAYLSRIGRGRGQVCFV